jgi:hypothetical protein
MTTVVSLTTPDAHACTLNPNGAVTLRFVVPADGTTNVPINPLIAVVYWVRPEEQSLVISTTALRDVRLRPAGSTGESVPLTITTEMAGTTVVAVPKIPLEPNTQYELLQSVSPCTRESPVAACFAGEPTVAATFRTGTSPDLAAPSFPGVSGIDFGAFQRCNGAGGCCGDHYSGFPFYLRFDRATDAESAVAGYNVYEHGTRTRFLEPYGPTPGPAFALSAFHYCDGSSSFWGLGSSRGPYTVRAVDLAGNEDTNSSTVTLDVGRCGTGCSFAARAHPMSGPSIVFVVGAAFGCRARRRVRSRTSPRGR